MSRRACGSLERGWSLVELAVGLAITAVLTMLLLALLPLGNRVVEADRQQRELAQAEQALLGYMRVHARLPPADSDGDGRGDAGSGSPWLPVKDLGLPSRMRIRYQVHPSLAVLPDNQFHPLLPPADQHAPVINELDLCMRLLLNQRGNVTMAGLGMPVAYYLGHSGFSGHRLADAEDEWRESAQRLPGDGHSGLATVAAGPGELASRLACPDRLARVQGSAQGAYAAHSALRMTEFNLEFREFDVRIAETVQSQARTARDLAIYGIAEAITNEAVAVTLIASGWPPDGVTVAAGVKQMAEAVMSIVSAGNELKNAVDKLGKADEGLRRARDNHAHVAAHRDRIRSLYQDASRHAIRMDRAGLNQ